MSGHGTKSDSLSPLLFIDCKYKTKIPFIKVFREITLKARQEHKIPILVFKEKYQKDELVMLRLNDFTRMIRDGYFGNSKV
ncbi:hypothetical protein KAX97_14390 [candidate division WOR-3 bacterium]|nr:hypothetical protein [candidate division WOR-3 bacterium]